MPNANYIKGVRKERLIVNAARDKGLIAFRSAGSHSPVDVCVIDMFHKTIEFIQCKPSDYSVSKTKQLLNKYKELNNNYYVTFTVV